MDILIRGARQLLSLRGPSGPRRGPALFDLGLIRDGAVLIRNGVIQDVGPARRIENLSIARKAHEIDATGRVVMPAFVDLETSLVHAHPAPRSLDRLLKHYDSSEAVVFRDVLDDGARGIDELSAQNLRRRAGMVAKGMLTHGTGTLETRSGYPLDPQAALKVLRVQSDLKDGPPEVLSSLLVNQPDPDDIRRSAAVLCEDQLPNIRRRRLASFVDLECEPASLDSPAFEQICTTARRLGFGVKVHAGLFSSRSAVGAALDCGAISVGNLRHVTRDEIALLSRSATIAVLTPGMALQLGLAHAAPGRELIDAGVIPALASGYHAEFSPGYNMQLILLLACRLYRFRPEEAIIASTINAAHALRVESSLGSIETGKQADLLILEVSDFREIAYYAGVNIVRTVIKRGEIAHQACKASVRDDF